MDGAVYSVVVVDPRIPAPKYAVSSKVFRPHDHSQRGLALEDGERWRRATLAIAALSSPHQRVPAGEVWIVPESVASWALQPRFSGVARTYPPPHGGRGSTVRAVAVELLSGGIPDKEGANIRDMINSKNVFSSSSQVLSRS